MKCAAIVTAVVVATAMGASRTDYLSALKKFRAIDRQTVKRGERVPITSDEINAYVQTELSAQGLSGVRDPRVELLPDNMATGRALIDFLKIRSAQGRSANWLMRQLLQGEKEVAVTTRIRSAGGTASVDVKRVEISGIPIEGAMLDFLVDNYLKPNYPDVKIGTPFRLHPRVERIEVKQNVAYIVTR